ncbi:SWIM zinc finger family protein [Leucothrix arctica]|uniref:SWIM-type domain-containing protein n=1 Tax=Leucothrix arctica TaxID=1481894 RepID=A0A317C5M3_9GAMM|nr:SWIM zinc finger family protein [Leucothrix arctica]PWQ93569.1 hypothetical protein DKT75_18290 [Leucothrix arctica]
MEFIHKYFGQSKVSSDASQTGISFSPDTLREPTYFVADLGQHLPFREAISALNAVVVSDGRFKPKDRTEYFAWLEQEEGVQLADFMMQKKQAEAVIKPLQEELSELNATSSKLLAPYYKSQQKYFDYLYKYDYNAWFVLDPVITVHPDQVFFECFSQDESSYGRLSCSHNVFKNISDCSYGTTNIDYSDELYQEFQKIRNYRNTQLKIDPSGFKVETERSDEFTEQKIDLPDSWVRGFLQVNSALTLPMASVDLHPMDVHNLCFLLRRRKERVGPRSLRFQLKPDHPVEIVIEPWGQVLKCPRSIYRGKEAREVRIWGRRRLFILERLIPIAKKFTVNLLGTGLPSFWVADMGDMKFTLGLSGWTANDWSRMGNFDLMAPRGEVDSQTAERVITALHKHWQASSADLSKELVLDETIIKSALALYAQQGRVLYDTEAKVYRLRELSGEPLPMDALRFSNPREALAENFVKANLVKLEAADVQEKHIKLKGIVTENAKQQRTEVLIDKDERLFDAQCTCDFYIRNKLFKGPCEHMLAVRKAHTNRLGGK